MKLSMLLKRNSRRSARSTVPIRTPRHSPRLPVKLIFHIFQLSADSLSLRNRLRALSAFSLVFPASRTWAQQALVEQAAVHSHEKLQQLLTTLLARPDLAWCVKLLDVQTKGGATEVEALSRLLLELRIRGPAALPSALLTVASINTPTLHRLVLDAVTVCNTVQIGSKLKRLSRVTPAPSSALHLPSLRHLSLRHARLDLTLMLPTSLSSTSSSPFPALVSLSLDHSPLHLNSHSGASDLASLCPHLTSLSLLTPSSLPSSIFTSPLPSSLTELAIPLSHLPTLLSSPLASTLPTLILTPSPSPPLAQHLESLAKALESHLGDLRTFILSPELQAQIGERDFWCERALLRVEKVAKGRGVLGVAK